MTNWKKVIVSGSSATLTTVTATTGFTGSLLGTASLADKIHTARSATDAIFYPTLVDSNNIGVSPESVFTAGTLTYNPNNGSLNATSFTGSLSGNATTATTATSATSATNAANVAITSQDTTPIAYNIVFTGGTSGTHSLNVDATTLTYNPNTTTLTTGIFSGALTGNATTATTAATASKVTTGLVTTNATYYIPFVDTNHGSTGVNFLGTIGNFTFNPNSGSLTANSFTGSLRGTASYATVASQSGYTMGFVLATTGSNLVASTTYRMGAPVRDQLQTVSGRTRIYVPRPGKVRYAHVYVRTNGTQLASAGTSSFFLNKNSSVSETIATSTTAGSSADATVSSTAISMSVVQGDFLEINWITPAWGTLPTAVEANAIIYIENNI